MVYEHNITQYFQNVNGKISNFRIFSNFAKLNGGDFVFYDNFLKYCNLVGKSPTAVLSEVGISKSANTRWQKGEKPTPANVLKLADYFGISPEDLTGSTGPAQKKAHADTSNSKTQSDGQLMAAFFEGGEDLSEDEMAALWQDAKDYIQWKLSQRRKAKDDQ